MRFSYLLAGMLALSLVACGQKSSNSDGASTNANAPATPPVAFVSSDVTGLDYAKDFALTDHTGKARTLGDFKGKVVVMFFGYTQCPDVCPTTMHDLSEAMKLLGSKGDQVQVLFVTLDPERDTKELLAQYVPAFDTRFLGLYGDLAATEKVAKDYRVFYEKVPGKEKGSYTLDHTAGSYVYDKEGHVRLFVRNATPIDGWAHDLKILLDGH